MSNVAIISDLHLGCHGDSENWHNITLKWGMWLKEELEQANITNIIICGDFFDNRNEIGVKTISVASELMDMFNDFEVTMIAGNHDLFYRNRTDINSISIFDGRENVDVISEMTLEKIGNKTVTYIPWGSDISKAPKSDIIFGHLEINGFKMMPGRVAEGVTAPKALTSKASLIFSGHFHLRDERKYKNAEIIYVGSPYQINWGESTNIPGYYILDVDTMDYSFVENVISPRHIKMSSNNLQLEDISDNIIKIEIDSNTEEDVMETLKGQVFSNSPLEVQFNVLRDELAVDGDIKYSGSVDISEVMMDFVDELNVEDYKDDVKDKLVELYNKYT